MNVTWCRVVWKPEEDGKTEMILIKNNGESLTITFDNDPKRKQKVFQGFFGEPLGEDISFAFGPIIAEDTFGYDKDNQPE